MARFFIDRPIFAWVIAIIIMLAGLLALTQLPISRYPTIAPPSVTINASYPHIGKMLSEKWGTKDLVSYIEQLLQGAVIEQHRDMWLCVVRLAA